MKWPEVFFEDLFDVPSRNGLNRPASVRGAGIKMVNMGELFAHDRIGKIDMELVPVNHQEIETMLVEQGDLLFARQSLVLAGAGKCSIVLETVEPTTFESHIIRVRLKKKIANPYFYYYFFKSPSCGIRSIVTQGVQAGIRGSDLKRLNVALPPLDVQEKIADFLSAYDNLIENNRRRMALLEEVARQLYREWFIRLRFPGYEHTRITNGVPEGWEMHVLDELCHVGRGGSPRPIASFMGGDIPWFKIGDATASESPFILKTEEHVTEAGAKKRLPPLLWRLVSFKPFPTRNPCFYRLLPVRFPTDGYTSPTSRESPPIFFFFSFFYPGEALGRGGGESPPKTNHFPPWTAE